MINMQSLMRCFHAPDAGADVNGHVRYDNFVLENQLKDQLATRLNLLSYATVDDGLAAAAGMKVKVHKYQASGAAEVVAEGADNSGAITMSYDEAEYTVQTTQAKFVYTDEAQMTDPFLVEGGIRNLSDAITNQVNADIIAQLENADDAHTVCWTTAPTFDNIVDAIATLDIKDAANGAEQPGGELFALCNKAMRAKLQKALKDDLKYVEAFIRTGYIGTVAGVNLYVCDDISADTLVIGSREAVTYYRKKAVETEQKREPGTRTNTLYGRLVGFAALTDATKVAKVRKPWVYTAVVSPSGNPKEKGWYTKAGDVYSLTTDTTVQDGTTYYVRS